MNQIQNMNQNQQPVGGMVGPFAHPGRKLDPVYKRVTRELLKYLSSIKRTLCYSARSAFEFLKRIIHSWWRLSANKIGPLLSHPVAFQPKSCWVFTICLLATVFSCVMAVLTVLWRLDVLAPAAAAAAPRSTESLHSSTQITTVIWTGPTATTPHPEPTGGSDDVGDLDRLYDSVIVLEACKLLERVADLTGRPAGQVSLDEFRKMVPGMGNINNDVKTNDCGVGPDDDCDSYSFGDFVCPVEIIAHNNLRADINRFMKKEGVRDVLVRDFAAGRDLESDMEDVGGQRAGQRAYKKACLK